VKFVRTGLGLYSDDAGSGLARFRVVVLKSDFGFTDGIEVGIDDDDAEDGILVVGTIEFKVGTGEVLPVDVNLATGLEDFQWQRD